MCPATEAAIVLKYFEKLFGNNLVMWVVILPEKFSTTNSRISEQPSSWIYLGSDLYIYSDYFNYCYYNC